MIRWHLRCRQEARPIEPSRMTSPRIVELETAKEILAEIFGVRPVEVEEMIHSTSKSTPVPARMGITIKFS